MKITRSYLLAKQIKSFIWMILSIGVSIVWCKNLDIIIFLTIPKVNEQNGKCKLPSSIEAYHEKEHTISLLIDLNQYDMVPLRREDIEPKLIDVSTTENGGPTYVSIDNEGEW